MASSPKVGYITFSSTTSWQQVTAYGTNYSFNHVQIQNYTDGDIEVAWKTNDYADVIVKIDTDLSIDFLDAHTPIYVRNITGTGGTVYFKIWTGSC